MKKETIVAIILGIAFGTIVATSLVIFTKTKSLEKKKVLTPSPAVTVSVPKEETAILKILAPENNIQVATDSVDIKGEAQSDSTVIIHSPVSEAIIKVKDKQFNVKFPLKQGENHIQITSYYQNTPSTKTIKVYQIKQYI